MASTDRSEPWRDRERAALKDLAGQLEVACEALHEDTCASLDDLADQLEATAERMPWQSTWRESVEQMAQFAREDRGELSWWVRQWRLVEAMSELTNTSAPRPAPTAADPLDYLEWCEVDGESRLVDNTHAELFAECDRSASITDGPGGIGTVDLPHGVYGPLADANVLTVAEVRRRIADGSIARVKGLGSSRCAALAKWATAPRRSDLP